MGESKKYDIKSFIIMDKELKKKIFKIIGIVILIVVAVLLIWNFKKLKFLMNRVTLFFIILIFAGIYALYILNKPNK